MTKTKTDFDTTSHKRGWLIFFGLLLFLTAAGICLEIWFNEQQRLRHAQIDNAEEPWGKNGPKQYEMYYTVQYRNADLLEYVVRVRPDGTYRVFSVGSSDEKEEKPHPGELPYASMEDLFAKMDDQLTEDQEPGKARVFATATFDRYDGHVIRYVRSVRATRERVEVNVKTLRGLDR